VFKRVHGLDVLQRIDGAVHLGLGDVRRQRVQDQDAGDPRVGVQLAEGRDHVGELDVLGQALAHVPVVEALCQPLDVLLVGLGVERLADQHRGQARADLRQPQHLELVGDALAQLLGDRVPVDHDGRHRVSLVRDAGIVPQVLGDALGC
jgi:hypothetical protein